MLQHKWVTLYRTSYTSQLYVSGTAEVKVEIRNPIHYGEPAVGSCLVSGLRYPRFQFIKVGLKDGRESCSITLANKLGINRPYLTRNFTITCTNNTRSVTIECYVITVINGIDRKQVDGKLTNITTHIFITTNHYSRPTTKDSQQVRKCYYCSAWTAGNIVLSRWGRSFQLLGGLDTQGVYPSRWRPAQHVHIHKS